MLYFGKIGLLDYALDGSIFIYSIFHVYSEVIFYKKNKSKLESDGKNLILIAWPMIVDLIAALPLVSFSSIFMADILNENFGADIKYLFILKLIMLNKLVSIRRLLDYFDNLHPIAFRLIPLSLLLPIVIHLEACGWIWLGSGTAGRNSDHLLEYIKAVYWTITTFTTVGYGDISPSTPVQMIYANATQIVGVAFFGYILSNVASLLARLDAARETHMTILDRVESYMTSNEVPINLKTKVRSYFQYVWKNKKGYDDEFVMAALPKKLKEEVSLFLNKGIVEKVPILKGANRELVRDIVLELSSQVAVPGEVIFKIEDRGDSMFFIHHGEVQIIDKDNSVIATLSAGSFFGETSLITDSPRNATVCAIGYVDLFILEKSVFEKVLKRHPEFDKTINDTILARVRKVG
jgi:voltage-gated potassium channel